MISQQPGYQFTVQNIASERRTNKAVAEEMTLHDVFNELIAHYFL